MTLITQILHAPENIFYQAVSRFQGSWLASASALLDTGLTYGKTVSPHMAWHTNAVQLFSSIVNAGWIAWDGFQLFNAFQTKEVSLLSTLRSSNSITSTHMAHIAGAIFSIGAALTVMRSMYHWASSPKEVPQSWLDQIPEVDRKFVSLTFEYPRMKSYSQTIYLTRIVMNVALAYLSPEKALLCGINAAGLAYSLLKTTQVTWLNLTRSLKFPRPEPEMGNDELSIFSRMHLDQTVRCKERIYSYIFPLLPNPIGESSCTICIESNPSTGFSPYSPFDPACLVHYIYEGSKKIDQNATLTYTRHRERGGATYYCAKVKIPESALPSCPITRNHPIAHYVEARFTDWEKGLFKTTVDVIRDTSTTQPLLSEKFLSRFGAIYSAFQAGLAALLHRHHELAGKIIAAQKVLSLFDIALLVQNYYQLYCTLYERTVPKMVSLNTPQKELSAAQEKYDAARCNEAALRNKIEEAIKEGTIINRVPELLPKNDETRQLLEQYHAAFKELQEAIKQKETALQTQASARVSLEKQYRFKLYIKMGLGIAAVTAVSAISVSQLNRTLAPFNMTELLKKVAISTDFSNMKISSSMPWLSYATECILASRLVVNFALAYFSTARSTYLTTAFLQTFTLIRLAQLPWIALERTFISPNGPMWRQGQKGPQNSIQSLRTTFELLLPSFSTLSESRYPSAEAHFEASIKAAYDYTTQFFKDSSWSRFFVVTKRNGIEIDRQLTYSVTVKQTLLANCADKVAPFFGQALSWAQDCVYGRSPVHIE